MLYEHEKNLIFREEGTFYVPVSFYSSLTHDLKSGEKSVYNRASSFERKRVNGIYYVSLKEFSRFCINTTSDLEFHILAKLSDVQVAIFDNYGFLPAQKLENIAPEDACAPIRKSFENKESLFSTAKIYKANESKLKLLPATHRHVKKFLFSNLTIMQKIRLKFGLK